MSFIKRNKGTIIAVVVFLVVLIFVVQIFNAFLSSDEKALYGNRLEGKDAVAISKQQKEDIITSLKEDTKDIKVREQGRILNITITAKDDASLENAKSLGTKVLEPLKNNQKEYYDIQVFIKKDIESNNFPIIGYKHHTKDNYTWTKDR